MRCDDFQITVYRWSQVVKIVPEDKNNALYPMKTARNENFMSFVNFQIIMYRGSRAVEIVPGAKKVCYSP